MKKALLAGLVGLVIGGGFVLPNIASANYGYNQTGCQDSQVGAGGIEGPTIQNGGDQIICADGFGGPTSGAFDGGAISAGATTNNGPTRVCVGEEPVSTTPPTPVPRVGTYVIIDGDRDNDANLSGYIGVSNFESNSNEDCEQSNNGSGTNSGGAVGPDGGPNAPIPLIVCGFTSGPDYGNTGRDGCYFP